MIDKSRFEAFEHRTTDPMITQLTTNHSYFYFTTRCKPMLYQKNKQFY